MSLLSELIDVFKKADIPVETGVFSGTSPDRYAVLTPLVDNYALYADNLPLVDVEEVRISLFDKGNYTAVKKQIEKELLTADITVTDRRYMGHEDDTGYHHIAIDVAKNYEN
jgi:hypothetical protein